MDSFGGALDSGITPIIVPSGISTRSDALIAAGKRLSETRPRRKRGSRSLARIEWQDRVVTEKTDPFARLQAVACRTAAQLPVTGGVAEEFRTAKSADEFSFRTEDRLRQVDA